MDANRRPASKSRRTARSTIGWKRTWTLMLERSLMEQKRSSKLACAYSKRSLLWPAVKKPKASWPESVMKSSRLGPLDQRFEFADLRDVRAFRIHVHRIKR